VDIGITWDNENSVGDISLTDNDIAIDYGLTTSVIISLFCKARDSGTNSGGFWGDSLISDDYELGSLKWVMYTSSEGDIEKKLPIAQRYEERALAWMIPDYAESIDVEFEPAGDDKALYEKVRINGIVTDASAQYWEEQFAVNNS
jgi:phage gp46-like protein